MKTPYELGQDARRAGLGSEANPFSDGVMSKAGVMRHTKPEEHGGWNRGWRDANEAARFAKHGRVLELGDFVTRRRRRSPSAA